MEKISVALISLATLFNAILAIVNFLEKVKKPVDKVVKNKFDESLETALKPIKDDLKEIKDIELKNIKEDVRRLDKNQCKNFLTTYLERLKQGETPSDIENERACEVYKHYTEDLHLNHFIKDGWRKLVEQE